MRKLLIILAVLLGIAAAVLLARKIFFSGSSSFQSIYLVPPDAAMIIETDAVFDAWNEIVYSEAWEKISHNEALAELDREIESLDSLVSGRKWLFQAIGKRKILMSIHPVQSGEFEYLYILNVGRAARAKNPANLLRSLLGDDFRLTTRDFEGNIIYEMLDQESGNLIIFSLVNDKVVLSENYRLVEAALKERDLMRLGRDLGFIDASKRVSGKGLFNIYINYQTFPDYLSNTLGRNSEGIGELRRELTYSAFSFDITPGGLISMEGYSGVVDSVPSFYNSVLRAGHGSLQSAHIIPSRVASMMKISFKDANNYYRESLNVLPPNDIVEYTKTLNKLERKLKISLEENFLDWMDGEIVLLQTQPSNLGRSNEFAAIIKAKNDRLHRENMAYVARQIEKNMPVKVREVQYGEYTISYISFPGLLKTLFGKMLSRIEKPYYTFIDEFIIFSNHPQTLKNIIDDYTAGNTLQQSLEYYNFFGHFDKQSSAYAYFDIPVLFGNIRQFVDAETWQSLNKNKPYIISFPRLGAQIDRKDNLLHFLVRSQFNAHTEEYDIERFDANALLQLFEDEGGEIETPVPDPYKGWDDPDIIIHDLDAKEVIKHYESGGIRFEASLKNGILHGSYREFYESGEERVRGRYRDDRRDGKWRLYDEDGNLIEEKLFSDGKEITE